MEPVDPRMAELLGGAGSGSPDELRSIVSRAGRTRTRLAAIAAGVALAAGGGIGFGISSATTGGSSRQIVATSPLGAPARSNAPSAASGPGSAFSGTPGPSSAPAVLQPVQLKKLFTRQAGSIDIRGFVSPAPAIPPSGIAGVPAMCVIGGGPRFQADVSTPDMVGVVSGFLYEGSQSAGAIEYAQPSVLGVSEGSPTTVVVVYTSSVVALVRMDFTGGKSDAMAPVEGWSALAAPYAGGTAASAGTSTSPGITYGTLTALDKSGRTLATQTVEVGTRPLTPGGPVPASAGSASASGTSTTVCCAVASGGAASGSGSTSGGSASGSGASGTGNAGSGAVTGPPASVASPPASTSPPTGGSTTPGSLVYPCKVQPLPAQVTPNGGAAKPGSGG